MSHKKISGELYAQMVKGGAAYLRSHAGEVNDLNVFPIPDGDTGDNMSMTIDAGATAAAGEEGNLASVSASVAESMLFGARGNSGVILSQLFAGIAKGFEKMEKCDAKGLAKAFNKGVKQAYKAVLNPTEGTILTVAREAAEYAGSKVTSSSTIESYFEDYMSEMRRSLERTPELLECLREAGVVDSGGAGYLFVIDGMMRVLMGEEIDETAQTPAPNGKNVDFSVFNEHTEMVYGYCTELLLQLTCAKTDPAALEVSAISDYLQTIGDSIVALKSGTVIKIHVHTLTPDKVLAHCLQYGEFLTVKVENMSLQHNETIIVENKSEIPTPEKPKTPKELAVIAVASGDGLCDTFRQLGADEVVEGGQTSNPSAEDLLSAVMRTGASNVIILPNNGNVILAAEQAAKLAGDINVRVLPTKNIGDGYSALSMFEPAGCTVDEVVAQMTEAMTGVATVQVSRAVRQANMNGVFVCEGDYIGISAGKILCAEKTVSEAVSHLTQLIDMSDRAVLIGIAGKHLPDTDAAAIGSDIESRFPDLEFYGIDGGQEVYDYILIAQ